MALNREEAGQTTGVAPNAPGGEEEAVKSETNTTDVSGTSTSKDLSVVQPPLTILEQTEGMSPEESQRKRTKARLAALQKKLEAQRNEGIPTSRVQRYRGSITTVRPGAVEPGTKPSPKRISPRS